MKIVFAGTPEFAAQAMRSIHAAGHEIVLALTQPDRRAGRGMHLQSSPVKVFALDQAIPILQPETLRTGHPDPQKRAQADEAFQVLSKVDFDAMVVVAYGLILPQEILDIAERDGRHGSFNIHASLLPRWRGAAPIQRAIESGDRRTGVCIMQMDAGLDTGDVVLTKDLDIRPDENSSSLHDRLALLGSASIVEVLNSLQMGADLKRNPQVIAGITYAEKIQKWEAEIDWNLSATQIDSRIRAFNPFPGAISHIDELTMKFWNSRVHKDRNFDKANAPGTVIGFGDAGAFIQCGEGVIEVLEMQKPGGKKMAAHSCLQSINSTGQSLRFYAKE